MHNQEQQVAVGSQRQISGRTRLYVPFCSHVSCLKEDAAGLVEDPSIDAGRRWLVRPVADVDLIAVGGAGLEVLRTANPQLQRPVQDLPLSLLKRLEAA